MNPEPKLRKDPVKRAYNYLQGINLKHARKRALPDHIVMTKEIFNAIYDSVHGYLRYDSNEEKLPLYTVCGIQLEVALDQGHACHLAAQALVDGKTVQVWL